MNRNVFIPHKTILTFNKSFLPILLNKLKNISINQFNLNLVEELLDKESIEYDYVSCQITVDILLLEARYKENCFITDDHYFKNLEDFILWCENYE